MIAAVVLSVLGLPTMFVAPIILRRAPRGAWPIVCAFGIALLIVFAGRAIATTIVIHRRRERPGVVPYGRWPSVEVCMIVVVLCNVCK